MIKTKAFRQQNNSPVREFVAQILKTKIDNNFVNFKKKINKNKNNLN